MNFTLNLVFFTATLILSYIYQPNVTKDILTNHITTFGLILIGSHLSARVNKRYKIIVPGYRFSLVQGFLGGILMGLGAALAVLPQLGNVLLMTTGVFYWVSFLTPQGFIYLVGMLIGGAAAISLQKYFYPKINLVPISLEKQQHITRQVKVFLPLLFLMIAFICIPFFVSFGLTNSLTGVCFALITGYLLETTKICMALMMKEIFLTRYRTTLLKCAIIILLLLITWRILGQQANIPNSSFTLILLGSFIMGFGYIMSDGCFMGSLWKAGQGNLSSLVSILGIFIGGTVYFIASTIKLPNSVNLEWSSLWQGIVLKTGLFIFLIVWVGAYFLEQPNKTIHCGSLTKWIVSESSILINLTILFFAPKHYFSLGYQLLGTVLYLSGVYLYVWARIYLGKNWGEAIVLREHHKIVMNGPYRLVKHPIYLSLVSILMGSGFLLNSLWGIGSTLFIVLPLLALRAREEQRILKALPGGEDYFSK